VRRRSATSAGSGWTFVFRFFARRAGRVTVAVSPSRSKSSGVSPARADALKPVPHAQAYKANRASPSRPRKTRSLLKAASSSRRNSSAVSSRRSCRRSVLTFSKVRLSSGSPGRRLTLTIHRRKVRTARK
jgi:hypothetical protein